MAGLCGNIEKKISDLSPCSLLVKTLFLFLIFFLLDISQKATLLLKVQTVINGFSIPEIVENEEQKQIFKALFQPFSSARFHQTVCFFQWADTWTTVQLKSQGHMFDSVTGKAVPWTYLSLLESKLPSDTRDGLVRWFCRDSRCLSPLFEFALQSIKSMKGTNQIRDKQHGGALGYHWGVRLLVR